MKPTSFILQFFCTVICVMQTDAQFREHPGPRVFPSTEMVQTRLEADKLQRLEAVVEQGASLSLPAVLQMALDSGRVIFGYAGVSAAMIIPGYGLWLGTSGYSIPAVRDTVTSDMIFGIASCTKTYIAALTLKLQEEGLLSLDDPLHKWLPTWRRDQYRYIDSNITVRQLLNHTSGIAEFGTDSWYYAKVADPDKIWMAESLLTHFVGPPHFAAGAAWEYCNTNYLLAGLVINAVTGSSLSAQLHQKFLAPLNLSSTYLSIEDSLPGNRAHPWGDYGNNTGPKADLFSYQFNSHYSSILACGGMFSKPENMVRWISSLFGGKVLNPSSLDQMLTCTPQSEQSPAYLGLGGHGLGVGKHWIHWGNLVLAHDGKTPGYESVTELFPAIGLSLATCQNSNYGNELADTFAALVLFKAYLRYYVRDFSADKGYCRPGVDTVWLRAHVPNPDGRPLTVKAHIETGGTAIDSLLLYDDGSHDDSTGGDGVWGASWKVPTSEAIYTAALTRFDPADSSLLTYRFVDVPRLFADMPHFTTAGPLTLDSVSFTKSFGGSYRLKPYVRNNGSSLNIRGASVALRCDDPWVKVIGRTAVSLPDLAPGVTLAPTAVIGLSCDTAAHPAFFNLKAEMAVEGRTYWTDSTRLVVTGVDGEKLLPLTYALEQNYPNPFNPTTTIEYELPQRAHVVLTVFNMLGQTVTTLLDEVVDAGYHEAQFDASDLASGVYLYRLAAGDFIQTRKMILLR